MGFSRQDYWSGLSLLTPGDLPAPGDQAHSFCISCVGRQVLYHFPPGKWPLCVHTEQVVCLLLKSLGQNSAFGEGRGWAIEGSPSSLKMKLTFLLRVNWKTIKWSNKRTQWPVGCRGLRQRSQEWCGSLLWTWRWTGRLGMLQSMESQRVGHDWATEQNWTERVDSHVDGNSTQGGSSMEVGVWWRKCWAFFGACFMGYSSRDAHRSFDPEAQGKEPSNRWVHKFKSLPCAGLCSEN